ncbi:hypothetical protein [Nocardioides rubriscoriae]|nr:hypothetical protein [Nocardioides rubriscoriae]
MSVAVVLPGADHALSSTGDGLVSPAILARAADAAADFLERLTRCA